MSAKHQVRVDSDTHGALEYLADQRGCTLGSIVALAIEAYLVALRERTVVVFPLNKLREYCGDEDV